MYLYVSSTAMRGAVEGERERGKGSMVILNYCER